jgi:hypothetical protein
MDFDQAHQEENWDNPRRWPKVLFEALWAHCIFRNGAR